MAKARSAKQKANDKRLGMMAKARAAKGGGWGNAGPKGSGGGGKRSKGKRGKPSAAQVAKMRAGAKAYWAKKRGKPKRPMPLKVLKMHHARLGKLIAQGGKK